MAAAASRAEANVPVCVALIALTIGLLVVLLSLRFACRLNEHEPRCLVQTVHPSGLIDGSADSPHSACFNASVAAAINERFRSATRERCPPAPAACPLPLTPPSLPQRP